MALSPRNDGGRRYNDNQWHHLIATRKQAVGTIIVDNQYSGNDAHTYDIHRPHFCPVRLFSACKAPHLNRFQAKELSRLIVAIHCVIRIIRPKKPFLFRTYISIKAGGVKPSLPLPVSKQSRGIFPHQRENGFITVTLFGVI